VLSVRWELIFINVLDEFLSSECYGSMSIGNFWYKKNNQLSSDTQVLTIRRQYI
jgi:hypothetical protein